MGFDLPIEFAMIFCNLWGKELYEIYVNLAKWPFEITM